jgi:short-subunit dehydrogenase
VNLDGVHAVITGGSKGIGAAIARELASCGARLSIVARPSAELDAVVAAIGAKSIEADLTDVAATETIGPRCVDANGPVSILINNAALARTGHFYDKSAKDIRDQMFTNLLAPVELARQLLPEMKRRPMAAIVTVSSVGGEVGVPGTTGYAIAKAGLTMFAMHLRAELRGTHVANHLVMLGEVGGTQLVEEFRSDPLGARIANRFSMAPSVTPEEVSRRVVLALAGSRHSSVIVLPKVAAGLVHARLFPSRVATRLMTL